MLLSNKIITSKVHRSSLRRIAAKVNQQNVRKQIHLLISIRSSHQRGNVLYIYSQKSALSQKRFIGSDANAWLILSYYIIPAVNGRNTRARSPDKKLNRIASHHFVQILRHALMKLIQMRRYNRTNHRTTQLPLQFAKCSGQIREQPWSRRSDTWSSEFRGTAGFLPPSCSWVLLYGISSQAVLQRASL